MSLRGGPLLSAALAVLAACGSNGAATDRGSASTVRADDHGSPTVTSADEPSATARVPVGFADVVSSLEGSVVAVISTVERRDDDGRNRVQRGIGAGVIVSSTGEILTNEHVVASASAVHVELADLRRVPAHVVVRDPRLDLALLRLEQPVDDLRPVTFRDVPARPGEWVMAVGQPFGLGNTMTVGIVSGLGRDFAELGGPDGLRPDGVWSFIQTDASVNIGNSGGPLVDIRGEVVGITTAVRVDGQGLAFAIPVELVHHFLDEIREQGRVRHPRLGIRAKNVGPEVYPARMRAVAVTHVEDGGPGDEAGLLAGDIILAVDGEPVGRVSEVTYRVLLHGADGKLALTVARDGDATTELTLRPHVE